MPGKVRAMSSSPYENRLLLSLSKADLGLLSPGLEPTDLSLRLPIEHANTTIKHIYFPDSGIISVVVKLAAGELEAGVVGREGMSGVSVLLGNHRSPNEAYVQVAGLGHRVGAKKLRVLLEQSPTMRLVMQLYAHVFMMQLAQTAWANGKAKIESRLARWLLMALDRQDTSDLPLTHEFLAIMLGVRRPGVTGALQALEAKGLVRAGRGVIRVANRKGLVRVAGDSYGVVEAEYKRLLG